MRKTGGRENGNLLATSDGVHGVDGGDTGGDHFFGVNLRYILATGSFYCIFGSSYSRVWVDRLSVDIQVILSQHLGTLIDRTSRTVEYSTKHVFGHAQLQAVSGEFDFSLIRSQQSLYSQYESFAGLYLLHINAWGTFENLVNWFD